MGVALCMSKVYNTVSYVWPQLPIRPNTNKKLSYLPFSSWKCHKIYLLDRGIMYISWLTPWSRQKCQLILTVILRCFILSYAQYPMKTFPWDNCNSPITLAIALKLSPSHMLILQHVPFLSTLHFRFTKNSRQFIVIISLILPCHHHFSSECMWL